MIAMIGLLGGGTIINGMMAIKNEKHRKQRLRKNSSLLLGIHQDIEIGVCQKMKKKKQKNYGHKHRLFLYLVTRYKKFLGDEP